MIIAATGHRDGSSVQAMRERTENTLRSIDCSLFITGMAAGFDLISASVAIELGVPVLAAKPWTTHKPRKADRELYAYVIENAWEVYPVTEAETYPGAWVYHVRDKWMMNECDNVLAWWDGRESGGTYETLKALGNKRPVRNIYVPF